MGTKPNYRRAVLRLTDLDHSKLAVLNSPTSLRAASISPFNFRCVPGPEIRPYSEKYGSASFSVNDE